MNSKLLYFYVFAIIFFADAYFILPWLRPVTLLNYVLLFQYFKNPKIKFPIQVVKLKNLFYVFMIYIILVDIYQNNIIKALSVLAVYLLLSTTSAPTLNNSASSSELFLYSTLA